MSSKSFINKLNEYDNFAETNEEDNETNVNMNESDYYSIGSDKEKKKSEQLKSEEEEKLKEEEERKFIILILLNIFKQLKKLILIGYMEYQK